MSLMMCGIFFFFDDYIFPHSTQSWQVSVPTSQLILFYFLRLFLKRRKSALSETSSSWQYSERERKETRIVIVKACKYCVMHAISHICKHDVSCVSLYINLCLNLQRALKKKNKPGQWCNNCSPSTLLGLVSMWGIEDFLGNFSRAEFQLFCWSYYSHTFHFFPVLFT